MTNYLEGYKKGIKEGLLAAQAILNWALSVPPETLKEWAKEEIDELKEKCK